MPDKSIGKAEEITGFWLGLAPEKHFTKDPVFDAELRERFLAQVQAARAGALDHWAQTPQGSLGLILLLDQFTRNIFRDTPEMFSGDAKALATARSALANGFDQSFDAQHRSWFYMPFMHSEDLDDQQQCVSLCHANSLAETVPYAREHADIIARFGRFPHRNRILGRRSTPQELAFLDAGGFAG